MTAVVMSYHVMSNATLRRPCKYARKGPAPMRRSFRRLGDGFESQRAKSVCVGRGGIPYRKRETTQAKQ